MTEYRGQQGFSSSASSVNAEDFRLQQAINRINTAEPVRVVAVHPGAGHAGTVDVLPLVRLVAGDGSTRDQGALYTLPYFRLQGGKNAVITDPQPGDVGFAIYAMRDAEAVKAQRGGPVNPGSGRAYDKGDGWYLGGFLNAEPERFVKIDDNGVTIEGVMSIEAHGQTVTLHADSKIVLDAPLVEVAGPLVQTGERAGGRSSFKGGFVNTGGSIESNGITLETHTHGGVEPGGGSTGGPQ